MVLVDGVKVCIPCLCLQLAPLMLLWLAVCLSIVHQRPPLVQSEQARRQF